MKNIIRIFLILILISCENENLPGGFYVDGEEFKKQFKGVENEILSEYPIEIDSIINSELINVDVEILKKKVYHPVIKMTSPEKNPFIDREQYTACITIKRGNGNEVWLLEFDKETNLLTKERWE